MSLPSVPFEADIDFGASVFSPDGARDWGKVGSAHSRGTVTALFEDKARISSPLWSGKPWSVRQVRITPVFNDPTPTANLVYRLEVYDDLTAIMFDGNGNILWQNPSSG